MSTTKTIKPLEDYGALTDEQVVSRGTAVANAMTGNVNFPNPPVDLAALKTGIATLTTLIAEAKDGSKKVMAEKRKQRAVVVKMLRLLGRYVEVNCKEDMAIFKSSGFPPASTTRAPAKQLSHVIRKISHGELNGELLVQLKAHPKGRGYNLRYGAVGANGAPPSTWTTQTITTVKGPVLLKGLAPGTLYAFQVQTFTKSGFSDCSDSVTFMCT
jgi:hypothetical protein